MKEIKTRLEIELDVTDPKVTDHIVKKMIGALDEKELKFIKSCNVMRMLIGIDAE